MATNRPAQLDEALDRRILVKVRFPEPDRAARAEIWRKHLPASAPLAADVDVEVLAERLDMSGGYTKNAVLMAVAAAVHEEGEDACITARHLEEAGRGQLQRPRDEDSELVRPEVRLADVVLSTTVRTSVEELVAAARNRRTVLERWGIGGSVDYGKGLSALFTGDPGTGKTLTAHAVAGELSKPLVVASIPAVVSKWVGQTERNLDALFRAARGHGAVLFLDEADSLLMARGEGRASRHDDSVVNAALRLIEQHDGVVLLATNLAEVLDRALLRRLTYRLQFPFPDAGARAKIWRTLIGTTAPGASEIDVERLGRAYALSGGHIKNAVFKAAFRAASQGGELTPCILDATAREEFENIGVNGGGRTVGFGPSAQQAGAP